MNDNISSLPSPVDGPTLLKETKIALVVNMGAKTKVVVNDDVTLSDAEFFWS